MWYEIVGSDPQIPPPFLVLEFFFVTLWPRATIKWARMLSLNDTY